MSIPNRIDQPENIWSGGPQQIGQVRQVRTTVKATSVTIELRGSGRITSGGWARKSIGASIVRSPFFRLARALFTETAC